LDYCGRVDGIEIIVLVWKGNKVDKKLLAKIRAAKKKFKEEYSERFPNVAVGIGDGVLALRVETAEEAELMPKEIDSIPTEVIVIGVIQPQ